MYHSVVAGLESTSLMSTWVTVYVSVGVRHSSTNFFHANMGNYVCATSNVPLYYDENDP